MFLVAEINAIELSDDKSCIFLAGYCKSSSKHPKNVSQPILAAVRFDQELTLISSQIFSTNHVHDQFTSISKAKHSDNLIIGSLRALHVVKYIDGAFEKLLEIENPHTGFVTDLYLLNNTLYSICKDDEYVAVTEFSKYF